MLISFVKTTFCVLLTISIINANEVLELDKSIKENRTYTVKKCKDTLLQISNSINLIEEEKIDIKNREFNLNSIIYNCNVMFQFCKIEDKNKLQEILNKYIYLKKHLDVFINKENNTVDNLLNKDCDMYRSKLIIDLAKKKDIIKKLKYKKTDIYNNDEIEDIIDNEKDIIYRIKLIKNGCPLNNEESILLQRLLNNSKDTIKLIEFF